jgi:hypothetical protein
MKFENFGRKAIGEKESLRVKIQELLQQMSIGEPTVEDRHKIEELEQKLQDLLGDDTSVEEYLNSQHETSSENDNDNTDYPIRSTA